MWKSQGCLCLQVLTRSIFVSLSEGHGAQLAAICSEFHQEFPCLLWILVLAEAETGFSTCFMSGVWCKATGNQHSSLHEGSHGKQLAYINNSAGVGSHPPFILNRCLLSSQWCSADLWHQPIWRMGCWQSLKLSQGLMGSKKWANTGAELVGSRI